MALAQPSIAGVGLPEGIYARGKYMFQAQAVVISADGTAVAVGGQRAIWRYDRLTAAQLNYWRYFVLQGEYSRSTTFELWVNNDRTTTFSFTSGTVYAPDLTTVEPLSGGYYGPVEIRFDYLLPLYTEPSAFILASSTLGGDDLLVSDSYT